MEREEWSAERIGALVDAEFGPYLAKTLPPWLPEGPITAALVREIDARLQS